MKISQPAILFLSGASGVGKTTLAKEVYHRRKQTGLIWVHPDGFGVASLEEMIQQAGTLARYQERSTHFWIERILGEYNDASVVIIDSQSNLQFVYNAYKHFQVEQGGIILVHCDQIERERRLFEERHQPELVNPQMQNWAKFLHQQALELGVSILNTSITPLQESIALIESEINRLCSGHSAS